MNLLRESHQESSQSNVTNPLYHLSFIFFLSRLSSLLNILEVVKNHLYFYTAVATCAVRAVIDGHLFKGSSLSLSLPHRIIFIIPILIFNLFIEMHIN